MEKTHGKSGSAFSILCRVLAVEDPTSLYRGMATPLASVTFQVIETSLLITPSSPPPP